MDNEYIVKKLCFLVFAWVLLFVALGIIIVYNIKLSMPLQNLGFVVGSVLTFVSIVFVLITLTSKEE